ncbi:MAG: radical SAM protein [Oscillospiraceae bacterium]|jgi:putative pyruvate formate lyase activating enzyme|nr:radical SAM protein [Oscillospiraceae bacterium]
MICTLCPRACGVTRTDTQGNGFCGMPALPVVARAAPHLWEEPCISGQRGSGAVFFSGCTLRCGFCQNVEISQGGVGRVISISHLRNIFHTLIKQGVHNINLVTPTHFARAIGATLEVPLPVPVVWNSNGYESVETLRALEGKIQIYLPDLKYLDDALAQRVSGVTHYAETAKAAISEMVRQVGPYQLSDDGLLQRGVIIRHLMLPGQLPDTKRVIDWVSSAFPPKTVLFSLMSQYVPLGRAPQLGLSRTITKGEYRVATEYLLGCGIEDGYMQELDAAQTSYIPLFDGTGV